MHSLTAVYDHQFYEEARGFSKHGLKADKNIKKRHMWLYDNRDKNH